MHKERWQLIDSTFHGALARQGEARFAFLDEVCAGDEELRGEIEELIRQDGQASSFIESGALEIVAREMAEDPVDRKLSHALDSTSAPQRIGHYKVLAHLASGGMGEIYRAHDTKIGRDVAIKVLPADFSEDPDRLRRFEQEARTVGMLNHPNILIIHEIGAHDGGPYLVSELLEGETLRGCMAQGEIPTRLALDYALQIARGLMAAHEKGIVHRDLKPENLFITGDGRVKILDFGLAKLTHSKPRVGHDGEAIAIFEKTEPGVIMGTARYMSPEQVRGEDADHRSDLFAFGAVLYEMLTGKRAFEGKSTVEMMNAVLNSDPADLAETNGDLSPAIKRVVRHCLEKRPGKRFQSANDLSFALETLVDTLDDRRQSAGDTKPAPMLHVDTPRRPKRRWSWIVAAVLALVIGIGYFRSQPAIRRAVQLWLIPPEGERFVLGITDGGMAVSPDGNTVTFVASNKGKISLWVQPLDGPARPLPGTEGAAFPFWKPDGQSIGFFAGDKLLRIPIEGGAPSSICSTPTGRGGTWTEDGRILFGTPKGLFLVSDSPPGNPLQITTADEEHGEIAHRWPQALPGGLVLYWAAGRKPDNSGVHVTSLSNPGKSVRLLTNNSNAVYAPGGDGKEYLVWLRGETLVAQELDLRAYKLLGEARPVTTDPVSGNVLSGKISVSASATGKLLFNFVSNLLGQLTWFDRDGRQVGTLGEPHEYTGFRLSPDGLRLAVARNRGGGSDLWELETGSAIESKLTSDPWVASYPAYFTDNRTMLFAGGNPRNLYRRDVSGAQHRLTQGPTQIMTDLSRDGLRALYYQTGNQRDLWTLLLPGDAEPVAELYLGTVFNESWGRFSLEASPRWIAYQSDLSGQYEVYVDTIPKRSDRVKISKGGGTYPQWGAGGNELFYVSADGKLVAVDLKLTPGSVQPLRWNELFAVAGGDLGFSPYEAAPNGQFLVDVMPDRPPLALIVDWPALLKN